GTFGGLGGLCAGALVPLVLRVAHHPQVLIFLSALAFAAAATLVRSAHVPAESRVRSRRAPAAGMGQALRAPLLRWLALASACLLWSGLLVQYETRVVLQRTFSAAAIANTMGVLLAVASMAGVVTQALLTGPLLERFGVGVALAVLPVTMAALLAAYVCLPLL